MARGAKHPHIIGVKDATANLVRPLHTRRACGADFAQLSGEDHTAISFMAAGGHGCISVTANVAPRLCAEMHKAWRAVFPKSVPMYAVGGVGLDNLRAFRAAGATGAGIGSSLYAPGVALDELVRRARALREAWGEA